MSPFLTATTHTHFKTTDSTNSQLISAIKDGMLCDDMAHLYTACHQTKGRGQHGRTWVSGEGNVFLSVYVPMGQGSFDLRQLSGLLSLAVGLKIAQLPIIDAINEHRAKSQLPLIGVKWANDVGFYDDECHLFQKLAGILIEPAFKRINDKNTLVGTVIGVGLNVAHAPKITDGLYQATCLKQLSATLTLSAQDLYIPMTNAIFKAVQLCNQCQDKTQLNHFIKQFNSSHLLQNHWVHIFIQNNMTDIHTQGRCVGIDSQGGLILTDDDGTRTVFAGMAKITQAPNP